MGNPNVQKGFETALNRHGYGFQYSVLGLAKRLKEEGASHWVFESVEFPVQVQGAGTRIDFILRLNRSSIPIFLLAECKRANPALSEWCFAKAPFVRRNRSREYAFLDFMLREKDGWMHAVGRQCAEQRENAYHIALEVRSAAQGDSSGSDGRGAIEKAATQVCRGLNGMIEFLARNPQILGGSNVAILLPVIFTTARIWSSDVDLSSAEISTGKVDSSTHALSERPWVLYQYHLSSGIKHSDLPDKRLSTFGALLDLLYVRTIPVVTATGIEQFLAWASDSDNYLP